jgi:hypothetical protein
MREKEVERECKRVAESKGNGLESKKRERE